MKSASRVTWGVILVGVGLLFILNAFGITHVKIFFDGWWTLFLIVPCLSGLSTGRDRTANAIGLCIGVFLLLCCQHILPFRLLWKLLLPAIVVGIGAKMIFGSRMDTDEAQTMKRLQGERGQARFGAAVFSGQRLDCSGEIFRGAELNAVFGGLTCDLRNAILEGDCLIQASAVFGGIDILVPPGVRVKISANAIFGGVSNKTGRDLQSGTPTVYIKGNCLFGGVDIK